MGHLVVHFVSSMFISLNKLFYLQLGGQFVRTFPRITSFFSKEIQIYLNSFKFLASNSNSLDWTVSHENLVDCLLYIIEIIPQTLDAWLIAKEKCHFFMCSFSRFKFDICFKCLLIKYKLTQFSFTAIEVESSA